MVLAAFVAVATGGLAGCSAVRELLRDPEDMVLPTLEPDPLYEELVSHYVELCAVSQYRPREGGLGGIPGHAVMYLKGACRDEAAGYPRLRACRHVSSDPSDPEHGSGVSVNRWFKNVNWVATPGKALFFDGELGRYERLDRARFDATVQRALDLGMFRGVDFHLRPGDGAQAVPLRRIVAEESTGTDFALRFGRTVFCARLPLPPTMLERAMDFLNGLNDEYASGKADYEWSGYADNCVHTLHNALAAAGVWKPKSVRATRLRQLFNLAVPANTFVDLAFLANEYPIEDFAAVRRDELRWRALTENGWLPAQPGALLKTLPVHQVNDLYDAKFRMLVLAGWLRDDTTKQAQRLLSDGRYLELDANLRYFDERYSRILAEREPGALEEWRSEAHRRDRELYDAYVEQARAAVVETSERLRELDRVREQLRGEAYEKWKARTR